MKIRINKFLKSKVDKIVLPKGLKSESIYNFLFMLNTKFQSENIILGDDASKFIPLHRDILDKIFTHKKRKSYIDILKDNNIINVLQNARGTDTYEATKVSKSYRINTDNVSITDLKTFVNITLKGKTVETSFKRPTTREQRLHVEQLKSKSISLNTQSCYEWINNQNLTQHQITSYVSQIINFSTKRIFISKKYRIYTNMNGLKREFRKFITVDGNPLVEIDLKTSQPFFLAYILLQTNKHSKEFIKFHRIITTDDLYTYILKLNKLDDYTRDDIKKQIMRLFFSASQGNILFSNDDEITKIIDNMHFKKNGNYTEDEKQVILNNQIAYNKNSLFWLRDKKVVDFKKIFQTTFPEIFEWIRNYKNEYKRELKKNKDNKDNIQLSELLTKYEAKVFLPVINTILKDNKTNEYQIIAISGHDAIYTTEKDVSWVLADLELEFTKQGYKNPQLVVTKY